MAERVGKKRATIANYLRLLKLPAEIQLGIKEKKIDMGHARAILGFSSPEQQLSLYKKILHNGLSVRKVEELVNAVKIDKKTNRATTNYIKQQELLSHALQLPVKINNKQIIITFTNEKELNKLINTLI